MIWNILSCIVIVKCLCLFPVKNLENVVLLELHLYPDSYFIITRTVTSSLPGQWRGLAYLSRIAVTSGECFINLFSFFVLIS